MTRLQTRPPRRSPGETPPPPPTHPGGGGGEDWTLLTVAPNQVLAHLIRGRLEQEGIAVVLDDRNLSMGAWLHPFGDPLSPVRVLVKRSDLSAASLTLNDLDELDEAGPDPVRPAGRLALRAPPKTAAGVARTAVRVLLALVAAMLIGGLLIFGPCASHWFCV